MNGGASRNQNRSPCASEEHNIFELALWDERGRGLGGLGLSAKSSLVGGFTGRTMSEIFVLHNMCASLESENRGRVGS